MAATLLCDTLKNAASGTANILLNTDGTSSIPNKGNVAFDGPAFSAYASTNQNVSNNTFTAIAIDTEIFDTNSCFNTGTYAFTPTVAGYYQFNGILAFGSTGGNVNGAALVSLYKNGSQFAIGSYQTNLSNTMGFACVNVCEVVYMNGTTDYVSIYGFVTTSSGTPQFQALSTAFTSRFNGCLVRGA